MNNLTRVLVLALLGQSLLTGIAWGGKVGGAGSKFDLKIHINGKVISSGSCTFVEGGSLAVNFGDVQYKADEGNTLKGTYRQPLVSNMTCSGDTDGKTQMKLESAAGKNISFGTNKLLPVIYSSGKNSQSLGIRLTADGTVENVGEWFDVDMTHPPKLEAELIKIAEKQDFINGDTFTASATLTMAFN